jgi:phytoene/squalene synthetase
MSGRPRSITVVALLLGVVGLAACGESAQDEASKDVCAARSEISKQISKIQGLTVSSNAPTELKDGLEAITRELKVIREAQPDLAPARKQQVEPAVASFEAELKTIVAGVASTVTSSNLESALKEAAPKIKSAATALAGSFRQSLAPITCS